MHGPRAVLPGVLVGSGLGETPTDAPSLARRSTRGLFSTMPWHDCDIPWQSQLSLDALAGAAHPHAHVYVCIPLYCTWVHIHHVHPQNLRVYTCTSLARVRACAQITLHPGSPPWLPFGDTPLPAHILSLPVSLQRVFPSHTRSRTLSHVPTPVPVDSSSRQRLAG